MSEVTRKRENCENITTEQKRRKYENWSKKTTMYEDTTPFPFQARSNLFLFFVHTLGVSITKAEERDDVTETFRKLGNDVESKTFKQLSLTLTACN